MPGSQHISGTNSLDAFSRMIRLPNLVILAAVQVCAYFIDNTQPASYLVSIILMTMSAASAGYIVNDIYDQQADRLNGRFNMINAGGITKASAWRFTAVFILFGAACAVLLSIQFSVNFIWIYLLLTFLLWAYARFLKGQPVTGNLAVSFFCAMAVLVIYLPVVFTNALHPRVVWLTVFAFAITWVREIVKDLEDAEGDRQAGYKTLAVLADAIWARTLSVFLLSLILGALLQHQLRPVSGELLSWAVWGITMTILFITVFEIIFKARNRSGYHRVSTILKIAMLFGTILICF